MGLEESGPAFLFLRSLTWRNPSGVRLLRKRKAALLKFNSNYIYKIMTKELLIEIGKLFRSRREACGINIKDLAKSVGTTRRTIYHVEAGESDVRVGTLVKIGIALNCEVKIELNPNVNSNIQLS